MSDHEEKSPRGDEGEKLVRCRRTGQDYDSGDHHRCPYCWGAKEDIERGDHEHFCDYDPKKDPISFGFPEDGQRQRGG